MTKARITIGLLLVFFISSFLFIAADARGAATVSVPLDTTVSGNEGEIKSVRDPVPVADLNAKVGWICDVSVVTGNPSSAHPFNDLMVGSNGDQVVASDVEEFSGKVTQATGTLILGSTVTFDLLLGPDEIFSGGMDVEFECSPTGPPNDVPDWCETGIKFDNLSGLTFTVPEPPPGTTWTLLVLKAGLDNFEISDPVVGQAYSHPNGKEISHAIICYEEEVPPSTTTTTVIPPTTTTEPPTSSTTTTSTTPETTTTTEPPVTTSTVPPTTSTTQPPSSTTTSEVPPPTLIESGDAGYIDEEDDGHEHENTGTNWAFFAILVWVGFAFGGLSALTFRAWRVGDWRDSQ